MIIIHTTQADSFTGELLLWVCEASWIQETKWDNDYRVSTGHNHHFDMHGYRNNLFESLFLKRRFIVGVFSIDWCCTFKSKDKKEHKRPWPFLSFILLIIIKSTMKRGTLTFQRTPESSSFSSVSWFNEKNCFGQQTEWLRWENYCFPMPNMLSMRDKVTV